MNKRRIVTVFFFLVITTASVFCTSLAIQVVQVNPGQDKVCQTSMYFEQSIIDFFFEAGHIVSNSPIYISVNEKKDTSEYNKSIGDASAGYMAYFVSIQLEYDTTKSTNPEAPLLENIKKVEWKIYSASSGKQISEGSAVPEKITDDNNNVSGITDFASMVGAKISAGLGKNW